MKLGKTKLSGERKEIFTIKDGDNLYRPLPPMGKLADAGVFSRYFRVVWGYRDSQGKLRPFISPRVQNFKTKMIDVDCAAFNRVETLKLELTESTKEAKALAAAGTQIPEELKKKLENLNESVGRKGRFNIDSKHHLNVFSKEGKIGCLKLAGRGMTAMRALFKTLEGKDVDPSAVENGRFININRQGMGLDTVYTVSELKEQVQTEEYGLVEKALPHGLTDSIIGRLSAEAYELDEIYPTPTEAEVKLLIETFERSELEAGLLVDKLFGSREPKKPETTLSKPHNSQLVAEDAVEQRTEAVKETPVTSVTETVETAPLQEAVVEAAPIISTVSETPVEAAVAETTPVPVNSAVQSDADFLADLGVKLG